MVRKFAASGVAAPPHPHGVRPLGQQMLNDEPNPRDAPHALGVLRALPDEVLLGILGHCDGATLARIAVVRSADLVGESHDYARDVSGNALARSKQAPKRQRAADDEVAAPLCPLQLGTARFRSLAWSAPGAAPYQRCALCATVAHTKARAGDLLAHARIDGEATALRQRYETDGKLDFDVQVSFEVEGVEVAHVTYTWAVRAPR